MRGVGQIDAIESVTFRHEEGNEGEKIGVERGNGAFYGAKLLKKQGTDGPPAPLLRRDHSMVGECPQNGHCFPLRPMGSRKLLENVLDVDTTQEYWQNGDHCAILHSIRIVTQGNIAKIVSGAAAPQ